MSESEDAAQPVEAAPQAPSPSATEDLAARYYDQLLRLKAEFENYRKRVDREKADLLRWSHSILIGEFLPIYDALDKACQNIEENWDAVPAPERGGHPELSRGLTLVFKEIGKIFETQKVAVMEVLNKPFDPKLHDIVGVIRREDVNEDIVLEVVQKGFLLEGRLLRPAKVRISKKPEKPGPGSPGAAERQHSKSEE
ncbi:MAG: nucleotide exchange factor GrpE [Elusimicrobia bacterium]|nr:nucleotide exchange factor GrpE [Elusimicrobiota bacterium]